jgi:hypothetical protein
VSGARQYLAAAAGLATLAGVAGLVVPAGWRAGWWLALSLAIVIQGPLGWWLMTSLGTDRFLGVWALGIFMRLALVALAGLILVPALQLPAAPTLLALVAFLVVSLAIEGIVAIKCSRVEVR